MSEEIKLLGAILLNPRIATELHVQQKHFMEPNAAKAFGAIQKCLKDGVEPNLVDVVERDKSQDYAYVAGLTTKCPSSANWRAYERNVVAGYQKYRLALLGEELQKAAKDPSRSVEELLDEAETGFTEILSEGAHDEIHDVGSVMLKVVERIETRYQSKGDLPGISTMFPKLDRLVMGFEPRKLYIVAGRPSSGKSAFLLTIARMQATRKKSRPGYITLESSEIETVHRALSQESKINNYRLLTGMLNSERDFERIMGDASTVGNTSWVFYDRANASLEQVKSAARRMVLFHNCDILYVDYLQIIGGQTKTESKYDHVSKVSMALKQLARDLNVPVVAAAQLNRQGHGKKPSSAELRESGQIEQDADAIILLHRPNREAEINQGKDIWHVEAIIDKNRDGALGEVDLHFNAPYTLFTEAPNHQPEEQPA